LSPAPTIPSPIPAELVHPTIQKRMIGDGFPLVVDLANSRGSWLVDLESGERYLDLYSFFASLPLGFNHPALHEPRNAAKLLAAAAHKPSNSDAHTPELASFVECFSQRAMPEPFRHLFFVEGGAMAVENALKTAFDWKVRKNLAAGRGPLGKQILHFRQAFHGRSGYTLSLTNTQPVKTDYFPKFFWPRVANPKLRFPLSPAEMLRVAEEETRALDEIRAAFRLHPHDIAAIIIEPIQSEGGDNHFRGEFLRALRKVADDEDAFLIFDEVQCGFGLTGKFWAYEHFGVVPDAICFGKKAQVCGILVGPRVDEVADNVFKVSSRINSTWGGGLTDMVRCEIILETIETERLVENAANVGGRLLARLEELGREVPERVSNVRGRGLLCAFDAATPEARNSLLQRAREKRLLLLPCGEKSIRLRPALTFTGEEADEAIHRLREAVRSF
jgi:L-lysine 6-transaminase